MITEKLPLASGSRKLWAMLALAMVMGLATVLAACGGGGDEEEESEEG